MSPNLSRRGVLLGAAAVAGAPLVATAAAPAFAQSEYAGYLMAHFIGEQSGGEQIYLTHSTDGLNWTDLNGGGIVLQSNVGTLGVRDPALIRSPEGDRYWIIATDLHIGSGTSWDDAMNRGSTALVVWESTDLAEWSEPRLLDVAGPIGDAGNAWAPEAIFDPDSGDYVVYWATNSTVDGLKKHRIWYARTADFQTATDPELYIDRPGEQGIIDTQIIEAQSDEGTRYYRASGDGQITIEAADSILGEWTVLGDLQHLGLTGSDVEGPMWTKFHDRDEWVLWLDQYATGGGYMPVTSTDLTATENFQRADGYDLGANLKRHGTILNLTEAEQERVLDAWQGGAS